MTRAADATRRQKLDILLRLQYPAEVVHRDRRGKTSTRQVSPLAGLPTNCARCPSKNWPLLGCQREGRQFVAKRKHRIGRVPKTGDDSGCYVKFCPKSLDLDVLAVKLARVHNVVGLQPEGLQAYTGVPTSRLGRHSVFFVAQVRAAWNDWQAEIKEAEEE